MTTTNTRTFALLLFLTFTAAHANPESTESAWVERSNALAYKVLESTAKFTPEFAGQTGVDGYDEEIFDIRPERAKRIMAVSEANIAMLEKELKKEKDPRVKQDIQIMIQAAKDNIENTRIQTERSIPYGNLVGLIFAGFNGLLDKQVPIERQKAALIRLKKYNGTASGYEPITELAKARLSEKFGKGLIKPFKGEVSQDLERGPIFIQGLEKTFAATELKGWESDLSLLQEQLTEYNAWVEKEIIPRTRESAQLPRELYELALKNTGVDESPERLIEIGKIAFINIRNEMEALAPLVAEKMGYDTNDYREVIRLLKKEQIHGDALIEKYRSVMAELDTIISREGLASVPNEPARVRMATAAETAQQPSAHLDIPRLVGNTGEYPEFIVPLLEPEEDGTWKQSDYAYPAMMWSLSAHEARPGHEMQFTVMLRGGITTARALFAFNSANVEGWALYAEAIAKPYMPLEGQLISLQYRLLRAARIWLDPMLNLGLTTPEDAKRVLMEEVVEDEHNAQNEIDRYTFRMPAQATAYYYGYSKLLALRADTEMRLKESFDAGDFHDFILQQGLLPPEILKKTVIESFVAAQLSE